MDSFIYIDGVILWVIAAIVLFIIFTFIIVSCAFMKSERENYNMKEENEKLKKQLSVTQEELYKATFKVPDVDEDYNCTFPKEEFGGNGDV